MDLLDRNIVEFYDDRPALDRLLRVLSQETGTPYIKMERQLQAAKEAVLVGPAVGQKPTLRVVLGSVPGTVPDIVAGDLKVLERRDEAGRLLLEQELRELDDEIGGAGIQELPVGRRSHDLKADAARHSSTGPPMSAGGTQIVPTGSSETEVPLKADIGEVLGNPAEFERRYARIRAAQPSAWDGPDGRDQFRTADRLHAEAGYDLVAKAERPGREAEARQRAAGKAQRLDVAIGEGETPRQRMMLLDAAISELGLDSTLTSVALTNKPALSLPPITPFEPAGDAGVKQLDEPGEGSPEGQALHERILRILDERGLGISGHYVDVLNELLGDTSPTPAEPETPTVLEGVYMGNHALHQQVLARLASKGLDIRSYQRELEEMGAEANRAAGGAPTEHRRP